MVLDSKYHRIYCTIESVVPAQLCERPVLEQNPEQKDMNLEGLGG